MDERWVCKRCYADNEGTATACVRCGLQRGADISQQAQQEWQAQTQPAAPRPAWRGLLRYAWIPVVAIVLIVGFFANQGQRALENMAVGQCFDAADSEEISGIDTRDCGEPHEFEVVHVVNWPNPDEAYPSVGEQDEFLIGECAPAFSAYVGSQLGSSTLDVFYLTPTADGWSQGDHEFVCAAYALSGAQLESSVRNSGV